MWEVISAGNDLDDNHSCKVKWRRLANRDRKIGKYHGVELVKLMHLNKPQMPSVNTYRRSLAEVVYQEGVERMVGKYNQRREHGERDAQEE